MSLVGFRAQNHPQQRGSDEVDDRGTTADLFDPLHARYHFTVDVAAAPHNTKCARYYTRDDDGLSQSWADESVWCNPPYSDIEPWVEKAWTEHPGTRGIVMLAPANRTEQGWWQRLVEPYRDRAGSPLTVEFLPGRIRFLKAGASSIGPNERPPFGCCLLVWAAPVARSLTVSQTLGAVL
jgi:phage N-6-adenine-methyltransferase